MAQTGASAAKVMRRKLLDTGTRRSRSNDLPITFGVIPSPQTRPALFIYRAKKYSLFDAAASFQSSMATFTQPGLGMVRTWPAFPIKSAITQCSSRN
jgi:hypothetical protein